MKPKRWLSLLIVLGGWALTPPAGAVIVDFEATATGNAILTTPTDVQGLTFSSAHYHIPDIVVGTFGGSVAPVKYLSLDAPGLGFPVDVTLTGGGIFSVLGLDASKLWANSAAAAAGGFDNADFLHLSGVLSGGGGVIADLSLAFGFASYALSGFTDLTSLTISGFVVGGTTNASWAVDNINYAPIPEPEIYAMLAAGLGLMGFVARRRKQQLAAA